MNLSARIQSVTQNANATIVMMQLRYWIMKAKYKGRAETAQSMNGLASQTKLTFDQVKRAVAKLRSSGLIRTEQHLFATAEGSRNFNTYRLTSKGEEVCFALLGQDDLALPEQCSLAPLLDYENTTMKYGFEEGPQPPTVASEPEPEAGSAPVLAGPSSPVTALFPQSPPSPNEGPMPHSVHDVQGLVAAQKKVHKPDSGGSLAQAWQIGMKEHLSNQLVPVGPKGVGMLKSFAKHCQPGTAEAILHFTLTEWIAFTKFCEQEAGAFKTPGTPTLQFLVKFAQQAVTFYLQAKKKPAMASPSVNPKPASSQLIADQVELAPKTVSLDEVLAPYDPDADYED